MSCPATSPSVYAWHRAIDGAKVPTDQLGRLARSSHALAVIGTKVYLFGGEHEPRQPIDNVILECDLSSSSCDWTPVQTDPSSPLPAARIAPGLAAVGESQLWVFGGRVGVDMGEGALADLWRFDTTTLRWTLVQESAEKAGGPPARSFHQMTSWDGDLYVFGGCGTSGRKADLWHYSVTNGTWEALPAPPGIKGKIIMTGGFAGEETNDMWAYDIATREWEDWSSHSASLVKRSVFGLGAFGSHLVLFGGEVDPSSQGHEGAGGFAGDTLFFDMQDKEKGWRKVENVSGEGPSPRGWYASAFTPEVGFIVSGGLVGTNDRLADLLVLKPTTA